MNKEASLGDLWALREAMWKSDPILFIKEAIGYHLTEEELIPIREKYGTNPQSMDGKWMLDPKQVEFLRDSARISYLNWRKAQGYLVKEPEIDSLKYRIISFQAAKGVGKTSAGAADILHFGMSYPMSRGFIVAPSYMSAKQGLYHAISLWVARSIEVYGEKGSLLVQCLEIGADKISMKNKARIDASLKASKPWSTEILSYSRDADAAIMTTKLAGKHAADMKIWIDEGPAVPTPVFEALQNTCTQTNNLIVSFFNPTKNTGWAIENHSPKMRGRVLCHHISALDSSLVDPDTIDYKRERYGESSNVYQVDVLGLPPKADDGSFIPYQWTLEALERHDYIDPQDSDPLILSIDIGGRGNDPSMAMLRNGMKVLWFKKFEDPHIDKIVEWIENLIIKNEPDETYIDDNFMQGIIQRIQSDGFKDILGLKAQSQGDSKCYRLRDKLAMRLRESFESKSISIPNDKELIEEINLMQEDTEHSSGKFKLLSKKNPKFRKAMRGNLGYESPNKLDCLMMSFYKTYSVQLNRGARRKETEIHSIPERLDRLAWLAY